MVRRRLIESILDDGVKVAWEYEGQPEDSMVRRMFSLMTVLGGDILFLRKKLATELGMEPRGEQLRYRFER